MAPKWTPEEDSLLREIYPHNSKALILEKIEKPWSTIHRRAVRLDLHRDKILIDEDRKKRYKPRSDSCSPEEIALLKEIFEHNTKEYILSKFKPYHRSWQSIRRFATLLGLKRDKEIILKETQVGGQKGADIIKWPENDIELLKKIYGSGTKKDIMAAFPERTWRGIREQAIRLSIRRDNSIIIKERNEANNKTIKSRYGTNYSTQLQAMQEKSQQTNLRNRGTRYPTQSAEVRDKVKKTVLDKYGVENVFQSEKIKEKSKETMTSLYGVANPLQSEEIKERIKSTNLKKYGVENPFQRTDLVRKGILEKYGYEHCQQCPEIRKKTEETNIAKYGFPAPAQNEKIKKELIIKLNTDEIKKKKYIALKKGGNFESSKEEDSFYNYLKEIEPEVLRHKMHPELKHNIDFYLPSSGLWVQFDGDYWHGKLKKTSQGPRNDNIEKIMARDELQNKYIPNLVRFSEKEIRNQTDVIGYIKTKLEEKTALLNSTNFFECHQYKRKIFYYDEDVLSLPFNTAELKVRDFKLSKETFSKEIADFIKKYEWKGDIGRSSSFCFTARYKGVLGGVVIINEPSSYSKILGENTKIYEAEIQRGATASWTPKHLGSRIVMFSCKWMVKNTKKRAFTAYADLEAGERGIIYQACGFEYLGDNFGSETKYKHPSFPKTFTRHYLYQTHLFKRWCRENDITTQPSWFKENGKKNLSNIPEDIKDKWRKWIRKILDESEKIEVRKKLKFVKVIPSKLRKNKSEKKELERLKTYVPLPFIQWDLPKIPQQKSVKRRNRKTPKKIQFIIENHGKISRAEMAKELNETIRWIKRQIHCLRKNGDLK